MAKRKSWHDKLNTPIQARVVDIPYRWARTLGQGKMLIATPALINNYIRTIPQGKLATINTIRKAFAEEYHVDITCPLTSGIFVWICAGAAEEDRLKGITDITPYWRVLKEGGKLNPKYPGGVMRQAAYLQAEGFSIVHTKADAGWYVLDYEKYLVDCNANLPAYIKIKV